MPCPQCHEVPTLLCREAGTVAILEHDGPEGHELFVLDESKVRYSIGKSADNDLVIDGDPAVSRLHGLLECVGAAWCVSDLKSTNGTLVNGEQLFPGTMWPLHDGDEILIGKTRLLIRDSRGRHDGTTDPVARTPPVTPGEKRVLIELCRPLLRGGKAFTEPASVREIAEALVVGIGAVKQHLDHLYDKFGILAEGGQSRRGRLANEAIQRGAVTLRDLRTQAN